MIYCFIFLGEFGYELLNWNGVIRKFAKTIDFRQNQIICCSRLGLEPLYEFANKYITISDLSLFKHSVASMYTCHDPNINYYKNHEKTINNELPNQINSKFNRKFRLKVKNQIKEYIYRELYLNPFQIFFKKLFNSKKIQFIFSSDYCEINNLQFGYNENYNIYDKLNLKNNEFKKIEPYNDLNIKNQIQEKLGFSLDEDFILCQAGYRTVIQRSKIKLTIDNLIKDLSNRLKVVLLNFDTKRNLDSSSFFDKIENCFSFKCDSFKEQSILIKYAKNCVFFTEGDFRSHNYLPPFMGKNVFSIADESVFKLKSAPIEFWNKNVFLFGGQIIPVYFNKLEKNKEVYDNFIHSVCNC